MKQEKRLEVQGEITFEVGNMFTKKATKSGTSGHVAVPKSLIGKKVIIIVPARQTDLKLIQKNRPTNISYSVNPELICPDCGKPWGLPKHADRRIKTCDCRSQGR